MKLSLLFFFTIPYLFAVSQQQPHYKIIPQTDIKGKVKSIKVTEQMVFLDTAFFENESITYKFNNKGNLVFYSKSTPTDTLEIKQFIYDSLNRIIECDEYNSDFRRKATYSYSSDGNKVTNKNYNENGLAVTYTYKYATNGNLIEWQYINKDSSLVFKELYSYDKFNNIVEEIRIIPEAYFQKEKHTTKYIYKDSLILKTLKFENDSILQSEITYNYDNNNRVIETLETSPITNVSNKSRTEYYPDSTVLKRFYSTQNGKYKVLEIFATNNKNLPIYYSNPNVKVAKICTSYKYDQYGNWIFKKEVNPNSEIKTITTRTINYRK